MDVQCTEVLGTVAPGFEKVRDVFASHFDQGLETGASFAVYRDGEPIISLWGGHADAAKTRAWEENSLANVWSTTKGIAAFTIALMVDRGTITYDDPVAEHWPEFAAEGKEEITIAQLLSHQAGLSGLREPTVTEDFYNQELMATRLAAQKPLWEPGTRSGYHAITYGFLAAELVKRKTGRTLGAHFAREIAAPWGIDAFVGLPEAEEMRVAEMIEAPDLVPLDSGTQDEAQRLTFSNPSLSQTAPNNRAWRAAEIPAAGGQASAISLARLYGGAACGGTLDGLTLFNPKTLSHMATPQIENDDLILGMPSRWGCGMIVNAGGLYGPNENTYGHSGWGGSFGCADPDAQIGFGYVMNQMGASIAGDPRSLNLIKAVYEAL